MDYDDTHDIFFRYRHVPNVDVVVPSTRKKTPMIQFSSVQVCPETSPSRSKRCNYLSSRSYFGGTNKYNVASVVGRVMSTLSVLYILPVLCVSVRTVGSVCARLVV